jgi:hypothetical protein
MSKKFIELGETFFENKKKEKNKMWSELIELYTKKLEEEKEKNEFLQKLLKKKKEINETIPKDAKEYNFLKNELENVNYEINNIIFSKMFEKE